MEHPHQGDKGVKTAAHRALGTADDLPQNLTVAAAQHRLAVGRHHVTGEPSPSDGGMNEMNSMVLSVFLIFNPGLSVSMPY